MPINEEFTPYDYERVKNAIAYINNHYTDNISADQLAIEVSLDIKQLQALMRFMTGATVHNYQMKVRLDRATADLSDFKRTVESIALKHGFSSSSHFSGKFKKANGLTPTEYRLELIRKGNPLG